MRYLVTGGAGFIGSHIAEVLAARGDEITILDNLSSGKVENILQIGMADNIRFIQGSVTDYSLLRSVCEDIDGIFHQAAQVSVQRSIENPLETHAVNATGTLQLLLAARECGISHMVCASTAAVYGNRPELPKTEGMEPDPLSPYAASKLAVEEYGKVFSALYGMKVASLRYFNVFGPRQDPGSAYAAAIPKFITQIRDGKPPVVFGDGEQTRDFVYVKDVVRANIMAMERHAAGVYNIARGERTSINRLITLLAGIMGREVTPIYADQKTGDVKHSVADVSQAERSFGFVSEYPISDALSETIDWFVGQTGET